MPNGWQLGSKVEAIKELSVELVNTGIVSVPCSALEGEPDHSKRSAKL